MSKPVRVLIGFAEALPSAETVFSLLGAGFAVEVFCRAGARPLVTRALPLDGVHAVPAPEEGVTAAAEGLRAAIERARPDVVLALDDVGLWLANHLREEGAPNVAWANPLGAPAAIALDKVRQIAAARHAGLQVLTTEVVRDRDALARTQIPAPAIVKPALPVDGASGRVRKASAVFAERAESLAPLAPGSWPMLVQPLVEGTGEGIFGFATDRGIAGWSAHRRLRMMNPHGSGASACVSVTPDPALTGPVEAMIAAIGWRGPFMVEFLRDTAGTAWFMELNGRLWGSLALARRAGFEYPVWAVRQALDPAFEPPTITARPGLTARHLGRELLHLAHVIRGPKSAFHRQGWPGIWRTLGAVLRPAAPTGFYNHDPAYPTYFLRDAAATLAGAVGGAIGGRR